MKLDEESVNFLVVTPYTKRLGIAVFQDGELVYFGVKTFQRPRTIDSISEETTEKLTELIDEFKPRLVILKSLTMNQAGSEKHRQVAGTIRNVVKIAGVRGEERSFEDARRDLVTEDKPSKKNLFAILCKLYSQLARFIQFQNRSQEEYYTPMLAAITIGVAYSQDNPQYRTLRARDG
jgi:RNase H-fold protein (predicted Holliday junction resolvase)